MQHRAASDIGKGLEGAREPLGQARHTPGYIYTSPEVLVLEKERIFTKDWLCVGRLEELKEPGDYMALRIADEPIIVVRDEHGSINAFSNICRHRGVEVAAGQGKVEEFMCPYHGWVYDLRGQLVGAPLIRGVQNFNKKNCRLKPLQSAIWGGFVFVNFDQDAEPFSKHISVFSEQSAGLRPEDCRLFEKFTIRLDCNWKLVPENLADWYHVEVLHRATLGHYTPTERVRFEHFPRGSYSVKYASGAFAPNGKSLFGSIPWLSDRPDTFAFSFYLPPNLSFFARIDSLVTFTAFPTGPDACDLNVYMLFPAEWFDEADFSERAKVYSDWFRGFLQEDVDIVASLQRGLKSKRFEPGPIVTIEDPIHHMLNDYLDRIFGPESQSPQVGGANV